MYLVALDLTNSAYDTNMQKRHLKFENVIHLGLRLRDFRNPVPCPVVITEYNAWAMAIGRSPIQATDAVAPFGSPRRPSQGEIILQST